MAFTADTGDYKAGRSDVGAVDPRGLVVDWRKNLSRGGIEPSVDEALKQLALDMVPRKGSGDAEDGSSGQINPILVRPMADRKLEVVGGFRRMRAALYLIESGICPDFRVKYIISKLSDAEAALANMSENLQREAPQPIQLAHAVRALTEDYGMTLAQVAGRIKRSKSWCQQIVNLVTLPSKIQARVASGDVPVAAAVELAKLPGDQQIAVFDSMGDEPVTAAKVREKRREADPTAKPRRRTLKEFREFLDGEADALSHAIGLWLDGTASDIDLGDAWDANVTKRRNKP